MIDFRIFLKNVHQEKLQDVLNWNFFGSSLGAFILDSIDTILSAIGFICNATALCAFLKNGQTFGYPIR